MIRQRPGPAISVLTLLLALSPLPAFAEPPPSPGSTEGTAPVVLGSETIFTIRTRIGSFSPEERARAISTRLEGLAHDRLADIQTVTVQNVDDFCDISFGDTLVMTVTDADARAAGTSRAELAQELAEKIDAALERRAEELRPRTLALGILYTALCSIGCVILLFLIKRLERGARRKIDDLVQRPPAGARRIEGFWPQLGVKFLFWSTRALAITATLVLFYFYVPLVFSFFPQTRGLSAKVLRYVLAPLANAARAVADYFPSAINVAIIAIIARYLLKAIRLAFVAVERRHLVIPSFYPEWGLPTYRLVRFLVLIFAAILMFPYFPGSGSEAFRDLSIFFGALLSLGSSAAVANVVAGVIITYMRPFKAGDRVKIADTVGDVIEKNLLVTRIRTIKNVETTVPNAMVLGSHIVNFSSSADREGLILHTQVTIGYDAPWRQVHALLLEAARRTEHVLQDPAPFVLQTSLDDSYVSYEINAYTNQPNRMSEIYTRLHQNIQDSFNEAGVEIMSPQYHAQRDGNRSTVPESYPLKSRESAGFRVQLVTPPPGSTVAEAHLEAGAPAGAAGGPA